MDKNDVTPVARLGMSIQGLQNSGENDLYGRACWTLARAVMLTVMVVLFFSPVLFNFFGLLLATATLAIHVFMLSRYYSFGLECYEEQESFSRKYKPMDDLI